MSKECVLAEAVERRECPSILDDVAFLVFLLILALLAIAVLGNCRDC